MQQPKLKFHPLTHEAIRPIGSVGGRLVWPMMGGDDTVDPSTGTPPAGTEEKPKEKLLTQSEVTAIAAREKEQGKAAAERAIAEQLGVPLDEAKAIIKQSKDAADAKKSEADKDREKAANEKAEAERERAAAKQEVHQARLERAFSREGFDLEGDDAEKAKRLLRLVTVEEGASYEDVLKDVKQIKSDFPALFGETEGAEKSKRRIPGGDPKGTPPKPTKGEDKYSAGAERARARYQAPTFNPLAK